MPPTFLLCRQRENLAGEDSLVLSARARRERRALISSICEPADERKCDVARFVAGRLGVFIGSILY